jgi:hypothetical protein
MNGKCEYEYLFSEGLAVVPRAVEDNIAILVCHDPQIKTTWRKT